MSNNLDKDFPQAMKDRVTKIVLHYGSSEDFTFEREELVFVYENFKWEELVFVYENGEEELVSRISTDTESMEDNTLGRMGSHNVLRVIQAVEVNPKCVYEEVSHDASFGYLDSSR